MTKDTLSQIKQTRTGQNSDSRSIKDYFTDPKKSAINSLMIKPRISEYQKKVYGEEVSDAQMKEETTMNGA